MANDRLGDIVKNARLSLSPKRSQGWLGRQIGVSRQAVNLWENNKTLPDHWHIMRLQRALRVDLSRWTAPETPARQHPTAVDGAFVLGQALGGKVLVDDLSPLLRGTDAALQANGPRLPNHYYASDVARFLLNALDALGVLATANRAAVPAGTERAGAAMGDGWTAVLERADVSPRRPRTDKSA